jgi:hypothetical protein
MISGFLCHIDGLSSVVNLTAFIEGSSYFMPSFLCSPWSLFHLFKHFLLYLLSFPLRSINFSILLFLLLHSCNSNICSRNNDEMQVKHF